MEKSSCSVLTAELYAGICAGPVQYGYADQEGKLYAVQKGTGLESLL